MRHWEAFREAVVLASSGKSTLAQSSANQSLKAFDGLAVPETQRGTNLLKTMRWLRNVPRFFLLMLAVGMLITGTASSAVGAGVPASLGHLCGHVSGASWKFSGQTGTQYNVIALPVASCSVAMKAVAGLTKQKPRSGALGPQTLTGPSGYRCAGSGIPLAHAGFCGRGAAHFDWAPRGAQK